MQSTPFEKHPRRIAKLLLILAGVPCLPLAAQAPAIRISAPTLGWVLSSDGTQLIEIAGVPESPRAGRAVALSAVARHAWSSPDAAAVALRLDDGLYLVRSGGQLELLTEIEKGAAVSLVWDRASAGFAACWADKCQARTVTGGEAEQWEIAIGSRLIAFSQNAGAVTVSDSAADWRHRGEVIHLDAIPVAAAFRAGTDELWTVDAEGRLTGRDRQGRRTGEGEMVPGAIGLVSSADGSRFFSVNSEREFATYAVASGQTERLSVDDPVDGAWPAPGSFAIRLHESAKRPIAIWDGDSGVTGWMPVAASEVRQ